MTAVKPFVLTWKHWLAALAGSLTIAFLDIVTPLNFTGYGPHGVDWLTVVFACFWFGIVGMWGGIGVYELIRRLRQRERSSQRRALVR